MKPRRLAALLILLTALCPAAQAAENLALRADGKHLNAEAKALGRFGALTWRGGLKLSSPDPRFGGISGLLIAPDGAALTAVTDRGDLITARLTYAENGWLAGAREARVAPLGGRNGRALEGKRETDAESLARLADGTLLVSFEHEHRIWRYPRDSNALIGVPEAVPPPPDLEKAPRNKGIESLVNLGNGALLGITQGRDKDPDVTAFLLQHGRWTRLSYPKHGKFKPTGAALLPGGDVIVLERRYTSLADLAARLVVIEGAAIQPGAALGTREVAVLDRLALIDNMEGVAARRGANGETLIYLISDDNFHPLQRTLLLMFVLEE